MKKLLTFALLSTVTPAAAVPLPVVCILTSEETASIRIRLTERTARSLKGELLENREILGIFQSGKPKPGKDPWWSFQYRKSNARGVSVLFQDTQAWSPYRPEPRPQDTNRVMFTGLASALWNMKTPDGQSIFKGNGDLLKAAAGFWTISSRCIGGRIIEG